MAQNAAAAVPVLQPTIAAPLWLDPLYYVLPVEDEPYQQALQFRSMHTHSFSRLDGLCASLGLCVAFLMLRFLWNNAFAAIARQRGSSKEREPTLDKLEEEIWVLLGGTSMLVMGWQCLYSVRNVCGLHNTLGCLRHWPLIPIEPYIYKYYNIEMGWYLHLMLKHVLGLGLQDNSTMGAHHLTTIALIGMSYFLTLHLLGLLMFGILNVSTPLLHVSKLASSLELPRVKKAAFAAFAFVFFMTRVVIYPWVIMKSSIIDPLTTVRGVLVYFPHYYSIFAVLLVVLWVMQCMWFGAIVRILKAAICGTKKDLDSVLAEREKTLTGKTTSH